MRHPTLAPRLLLCLALPLLALAPAAADTASFTVNLVNEPGSLDPALAETIYDFSLATALFEGLVGNDPRTGEVVPALARSWSFAEDRRSVTFQLRNASFSDGLPLLASDVRASWLRVLDPATASPVAFLLTMAIRGAEDYNEGRAGAEAVGIEVLGPQELRVLLSGPQPYFLELLCNPAYFVVPGHVIEREGTAWTRPGKLVSSGPFVLRSWAANDRIVVERNPRYRDAARVGVDQITFRFITDGVVAWKLFREGSVDWLQQVPLDLAASIKLDPRYHPSVLPYVQYVNINSRRPALRDPRVRQALSLAVDREALVRVVLSGLGTPARSLVPELPGYASLGGRDDPAEARRLLAAAGYPGGAGFPPISLSTNATPNQRKIAEFLIGQWKEALGIEVSHRVMEYRVLLDSRRAGDFDLARGGWIPDYPDASSFLQLLVSDDGANVGGYRNPDFDRLMRESSLMPPGPGRLAKLREAEALLFRGDAALIPLYFDTAGNLIDLARWRGWYPNPLDLHPWAAIAPIR
jgi:oligopeptide transport system substrate-binding protein